MIKKFPTGNLLARATYKLQMDVSDNSGVS